MKKVKKVLLGVLGFIVVAIATKIGGGIGSDAASTFIANQNSVTPSEDRSWYRSSYYGVSVESLNPLGLVDYNIPDGYGEYIKEVKKYSTQEGRIIVMLMHMDTNFADWQC